MADYFLKNIPNELWKEFKHLCVDKDITMREFLLQLIKQVVREKLQREKEEKEK